MIENVGAGSPRPYNPNFQFRASMLIIKIYLFFLKQTCSYHFYI